MTGPTLRSAGIRNVQFGANVTVVEPVNIYDCTIGDSTFVGPFVEIQGGVTIGKRCKIQSHAFICNRELWRSTRIGNNVSIGTNATIMPVTICDGVVVGAGSVVTKSIKESGIYAGNPARFLRPISEHS